MGHSKLISRGGHDNAIAKTDSQTNETKSIIQYLTTKSYQQLPPTTVADKTKKNKILIGYIISTMERDICILICLEPYRNLTLRYNCF